MTCATKDKTIIQLEKQGETNETNTLYRIVRGLEATGITSVGISYATMKRPEKRQAGEPDHLEVNVTQPHDFVLTVASTRESVTNKTIFGMNLKRDTFPTAALNLAQRFRWAPVGKNLKPTKQYVVTSKTIELKAGKPKQV